MAIPTPSTAITLVEIDEAGRAALFVDGVRVPAVLSVSSNFPHLKTGEVAVILSARAVQFRHVKSHRNIVPASGPI